MKGICGEMNAALSVRLGVPSTLSLIPQTTLSKSILLDVLPQADERAVPAGGDASEEFPGLAKRDFFQCVKTLAPFLARGNYARFLQN